MAMISNLDLIRPPVLFRWERQTGPVDCDGVVQAPFQARQAGGRARHQSNALFILLNGPGPCLTAEQRGESSSRAAVGDYVGEDETLIDNEPPPVSSHGAGQSADKYAGAAVAVVLLARAAWSGLRHPARLGAASAQCRPSRSSRWPARRWPVMARALDMAEKTKEASS